MGSAGTGGSPGRAGTKRWRSNAKRPARRFTPRSSALPIRRPGNGWNFVPIGRPICAPRSPLRHSTRRCLLDLTCWSTLASVRNTVLVCDDAAFMRSLLGDILAQAGLQVVGEAQTGLEAVEKFRALKPDLVTMDILMPDMGGIDAMREILKVVPDARVLMCSAMGQQRSEER